MTLSDSTIKISLLSFKISRCFYRDLSFVLQNRLEKTHLLSIMLDEDKCSLVKEQVKKTIFNKHVFYF